MVVIFFLKLTSSISLPRGVLKIHKTQQQIQEVINSTWWHPWIINIIIFHLVVRDLIACFDQYINTESVLYHVVYVFITWLIFSSRASFRGGSQLKIIPGWLFYLENMQRAERVFSSDSSYSVLLRSIYQSCDCVPARLWGKTQGKESVEPRAAAAYCCECTVVTEDRWVDGHFITSSLIWILAAEQKVYREFRVQAETVKGSEKNGTETGFWKVRSACPLHLQGKWWCIILNLSLFKYT